jgi:ribosome-associated protein
LNRTDAVQRFAELLANALHVERPRIKTRTPRAVKERRLDEKKKRTVIKEARSRWRGES